MDDTRQHREHQHQNSVQDSAHDQGLHTKLCAQHRRLIPTTIIRTLSTSSPSNGKVVFERAFVEASSGPRYVFLATDSATRPNGPATNGSVAKSVAKKFDSINVADIDAAVADTSNGEKHRATSARLSSSQCHGANESKRQKSKKPSVDGIRETPPRAKVSPNDNNKDDYSSGDSNSNTSNITNNNNNYNNSNDDNGDGDHGNDDDGCGFFAPSKPISTMGPPAAIDMGTKIVTEINSGIYIDVPATSHAPSGCIVILQPHDAIDRMDFLDTHDLPVPLSLMILSNPSPLLWFPGANAAELQANSKARRCMPSPIAPMVLRNALFHCGIPRRARLDTACAAVIDGLSNCGNVVSVSLSRIPASAMTNADDPAATATYSKATTTSYATRIPVNAADTRDRGKNDTDALRKDEPPNPREGVANTNAFVLNAIQRGKRLCYGCVAIPELVDVRRFQARMVKFPTPPRSPKVSVPKRPSKGAQKNTAEPVGKVDIGISVGVNVEARAADKNKVQVIEADSASDLRNIQRKLRTSKKPSKAREKGSQRPTRNTNIETRNADIDAGAADAVDVDVDVVDGAGENTDLSASIKQDKRQKTGNGRYNQGSHPRVTNARGGRCIYNTASAAGATAAAVSVVPTAAAAAAAATIVSTKTAITRDAISDDTCKLNSRLVQLLPPLSKEQRAHGGHQQRGHGQRKQKNKEIREEFIGIKKCSSSTSVDTTNNNTSNNNTCCKVSLSSSSSSSTIDDNEMSGDVYTNSYHDDSGGANRSFKASANGRASADIEDKSDLSLDNSNDINDDGDDENNNSIENNDDCDDDDHDYGNEDDDGNRMFSKLQGSDESDVIDDNEDENENEDDDEDDDDESNYSSVENTTISDEDIGDREGGDEDDDNAAGDDDYPNDEENEDDDDAGDGFGSGSDYGDYDITDDGDDGGGGDADDNWREYD